MLFEGKRILVTGGNGFIGKNIIFRLANEGAEVLAIDRDAKEKIHAGVSYVGVDITDKAKLQEIINGFNPEYIIHLAANNSHEETADAISDIKKTNVLGTRNLLEATKSLPYKRFIFLSSGETYFGNEVPFKEDMKQKGPTYYSRSKIESEIDCQTF